MDKDQIKGVPGCSIEHYITKIIHFILGSMDGDSDAAVMAIPVDYRKAFNRMLHSNITTILSDLKKPSIPTCAIRLIMSYLTHRSMCMRYKSAVSSFEKCPGGGPQGGLLTGLLFCLQVRRAGSPCLQAGLELLPDAQQEKVNMQGLEPEQLEGQQEPASDLEDQQEQVLNLEVQQENAQNQEDQAQGLENRPAPGWMVKQMDWKINPTSPKGWRADPKPPPLS